jgi:crotonobetainyl-CoA:carnitine CoA-transferase CaiB-like acyl-CoA transferase
MADVTSGLYAAISILARLRGGSGGTARVSLFDTMTELMGYPLTYTGSSGVDQEPAGMGSPAVAPYGAFPTSDGQTVVLGTTNDAEWRRLSRMMGRDDLTDDPRFAGNAGRVAHRDVLHSHVAAWCAGHELESIQEAADAAGIGNSRYNRPSEVIAHPHLVARDRWRSVDTPGGAVPALLPPFDFDDYEPPMGAVPALGEHTGKVLAELGYDPSEIERLRADGVVDGRTDA